MTREQLTNTPTQLLLPGALGELFVAAQMTGTLSLADRHGLQAAILDPTLTPEDRQTIDRLLRAIVRGKIQICDDVSTLSNS